MSRRIVVALACRNNGSRLYGKPLQNLDVEKGITILDNILACLDSFEVIDEVVLAISEGDDNQIFKQVAEEKGLRYVVGDEKDVLGRLIMAGDLGEATDIFRMTSESPFPFYQWIEKIISHHIESDADATFLDDIIDGCGYEMISLDALKKSHTDGEDRHRSELCTLYIRENPDTFKINKFTDLEELNRKDLRLTVDNPEDLIVCRAVYNKFKKDAPRIDLYKTVAFLDENPKLKELIAPFTELGYLSMYL